MPNFRRYYRSNALVFITNVTRKRTPYLQSDWAVELLFDTMRHVQELYPYRLLAYVILPDHFHWLMRVEDENGDFSKIMHSVKRNFTLNYKRKQSLTGTVQLWQSRFWDHIIRDDEELQHHFDYIHWNPVKHGYVAKPEGWRYTTYHHWFERGYYQPGWGHELEPAHLKKWEVQE